MDIMLIRKNVKLSHLTILAYLLMAYIYCNEVGAVSMRFLKTQADLNALGICQSEVNFDVDEDGQVETIVSTSDGKLIILNSTGGIERTIQINDWITGETTAPSIADIDNDGHFEMVVGTSINDGIVGASAIFIIQGINQNFSISGPYGEGEDGTFINEPPTLYDLDGDGYQEIIAVNTCICVSEPGWRPDNVVCLRYDGSVIWKNINVNDPGIYNHINNSCAIGDINGDNVPEIFVCTDETCAGENGLINCIDSQTGVNLPQWPLILDGVQSSWSCYGLALGDIQGDGLLELMATVSGKLSDNNRPNGTLLVINPITTQTIFSRSIYGHGIIPPTLGDINGDGLPEIVSGGDATGESDQDLIYCWNGNGTQLWSIGGGDNSQFRTGGVASVLLASFSNNQTTAFHALLNIGNVNGNAKMWLYNIASDNLYYNDCDPPQICYPIPLSGGPNYTPALIGWGNGNMGFTVGSSDPDGNRLFGIDAEVLNDSAHIEWGMYYHDPKHTGRYDQPVSGGIDQNAAWYGKYILHDNVTVNSDANLIIEAGTRVEIPDGMEIAVNGHLEVKGTVGNPVVFTSTSNHPHPGQWNRILINGGGSAEIENCIIEYAVDGIFAKSNTNVSVENTTFKNCSNTGFNGISGNPHHISNSTFYNCYNFGAFFTGGNPVFENNVIDSISKYGVKYIGDGTIHLTGNIIATTAKPSYWGIYIAPNLSTDTPTPILSVDSVMNFGQGGIYVSKSYNSGSIGVRVRCKHNSGYGLYLNNSSPTVTATNYDDHNSFNENKYGIYCASGCNSTFRWNNIFDNGYGVTIASGANPNFGTYPASLGNNRIENQQAPGTYEMKNFNVMTQINAQWNYWGVDGAQIVGLINYLPLCFNNPIPSRERRESSYSALPTALIAENYPNPFNANTEIRYTLPQAGDARINVYDISGRMVRQFASGAQEAGEHIVIWNGTDMEGQKVSSGVYFYSVITPQAQVTQKMLLLK
jgi:hypothetical protein